MSTTDATAAAGATTTAGPDPAGYFTIQSKVLDYLVLDVCEGSAREATKLITWPRGDVGINRQWQFISAEPGWWYLQTRMDTGFVLTLDPDSTSTSPALVMLPKRVELADRQLWCLVPTWELGYWYIQSKVAVANDVDPTVVGVAGNEVQQGADVVGQLLRFDDFESLAWGFSPVSGAA